MKGRRCYVRILPQVLIYAASVTALFVLAACGGEKEQENWSRLPGATPAASSADASAVPRSEEVPTARDSVDTSGMPRRADVEVAVTSDSLALAGVRFPIMEGWSYRKPESQFRAAELVLPGDAGEAVAAFSYWGKGQGGSAEANVQRWNAQFTSDMETTTTPRAETASMDKAPLRITLVRVAGTYDPGMMGMPGAQAGPQKNQMLFGVIVEGAPTGSVFVKTVGPRETMEAHVPKLEDFARRIELAQ